MPQLKPVKVPGHLEALHKKKLLSICYTRISLILPVLLGFLVFFIAINISGIIQSGRENNFLILDITTFAVTLMLGAWFFLDRPAVIAGFENRHSLFQKIFAFEIIIWGAFVSLLTPGTGVGIVTFIVCMLLTSALLLIEIRYFMIFSVTGIVLIHLNTHASAIEFTNLIPYNEIFIVAVSFLLGTVINLVNRNALSKAFILEQELEEKVRSRTIQLAAETEKALRSDELKTAFLANMSHEIRTPLNGILGFANLLRDRNLEREIRDGYLDIIISSGSTLLSILDGIIEVSRIESGVCEVFSDEFSLNDVFAEVINNFMGHNKVLSGRIIITNNIEGAPEMIMKSDRLKILQMLMNLVSNAVKYTDSGSISAGFRDNDDGTVMLYVKDTGKGIEQKDLQMIFERFRQAELSPYSGREGVGLGLTIVKGYAELLGGTISVESEPGKGSEFSLTLPVRRDD